MKIERLKIQGFGSFIGGKEFDFSGGFNLIYGLNEAGKSTILHFILAMLYGMKEEGRQLRKWLPEYEKYKPWNGKEYGGKLILTVDEGLRFSVIRDFHEDQDSIRIFDDLTGRELTENYEIDKTKERLFTRKITSLNRSFFISSVCINQLGTVIGRDTAQSLASYARSLADTGSSDVTAARAVQLLDSEIESIGKTERGKIFKKLKDREKELTEELQHNNTVQIEIRSSRARYNEKSESLKIVEEELEKYRSVLLNGWIEKAQKKLQRVKDLEAENVELKKTIGNVEDIESFPIKQAEDVIRIETELIQNRDRLEQLHQDYNAINSSLLQLRAELSELKRFSRVTSEELDQFSINEGKWRGKKEELVSKQRQLKNEEFLNEQTARRMRKIVQVFTSLPRHMDQIYLGWEKKQSELKGSMALEAAKKVSIKRSLHNLGIKTFLFILSASIVLYLILQYTDLNFVEKLISSIAGGLAASAAVFYYVKKSKKLNHEFRNTESLFNDLDPQYNEVQDKIDKLLDKTESASGEDFLAKFNTYSQLISGEKKARQEHLKEDILNIEMKIKDLENEMLNLLERAYPGIRPDKISEEMTEKYINETKQYLKITEKEFQEAAQAGVKQREIDSVTETIRKSEAEIEEIFTRSGVGNITEYRQKAESFANLKKFQRNTDEIISLSDGGGPEKLKKELERLKEEEIKQAASGSALRGIDENKARKEGEVLDRKADRLRSDLSELAGRIKTLEEGIGDREILESELDKAREELQSYSDYRESLRIAINQLEFVSNRMHRRLAPLLAKTSSEVISLITDRKYGNMKVDEELNISLMSDDGSFPIKADSLSYGTLDQVYLALRIALAELFSSKAEKLPIILDDSLTQYDDSRALLALRALEKLSVRHQVLMFSCHIRDKENYSRIFKNNPLSRLIEL